MFRLPSQLYRIGLGGIFRGRILVLNHIGRVTGKRSQAVLEVVRHDDDGSYLIASGWSH